MIRSHVLICGGTGCSASGSGAVKEALEAEIAAKGLADEVKVVQTGCFGLCALGPIMIVYPEGTFYHSVTAENVPEIVEECTVLTVIVGIIGIIHAHFFVSQQENHAGCQLRAERLAAVFIN